MCDGIMLSVMFGSSGILVNVIVVFGILLFIMLLLMNSIGGLVWLIVIEYVLLFVVLLLSMNV